jgi:hypothetical protein
MALVPGTVKFFHHLPQGRREKISNSQKGCRLSLKPAPSGVLLRVLGYGTGQGSSSMDKLSSIVDQMRLESKVL